MPGPRIALLGPVPPFRGGIAQHTVKLHRALYSRRPPGADRSLAGQAELYTQSFTRLYPRLLFPGESDREPGAEAYREPGVDYVIDTLAPWTWLGAAQRIRRFRADALVVPWWTLFLAPVFATISAAARASGIPTYFFCHNAEDHEKRRLAALGDRVLAGAAGFIVHTRSDRDSLAARFPRSRFLVHPHPVGGEFAAARGSLPRRAALELLFFGLIRDYKGLDVLGDALALLGGADVRCTVVGEVWSKQDHVLDRLRGLDNVELVTRFVSHQEAAEYFARADIVILPYRSASGSAVIPMAYHYGRPVIATRVGGLPDVVVDGETGFLLPPEDPRAIADLLGRLDRAGLEAMHDRIHRFASGMSWESLAEQVVDFVRPRGVAAAAEPARRMS